MPRRWRLRCGPKWRNKMNDENTTDGGYINSKMRTEYLEPAKTTINTAFPGLVLSHNFMSQIK